jgi:hypothetical protein
LFSYLQPFQENNPTILLRIDHSAIGHQHSINPPHVVYFSFSVLVDSQISIPFEFMLHHSHIGHDSQTALIPCVVISLVSTFFLSYLFI